MQTMIELSDSVFSRTEEVARKRGLSLQDFIARTVEEKVRLEPEVPPQPRYIELPLIHTKNPGKLDLANFDFDDLLA